MDYFYEKIAEIKTLCEKSGFDENSKEGKIFYSILELLDEFISSIEDATEEASYEYAFICPNCGEEIEVDEDTVENEEEITCPKCGNIIPVCATDFDLNEE